jgi:hypothetical protein
MKKGILLKGIILLAVAGMVHAQQVADLEYKPPIAQPAYEAEKGPCVAIDEAHHNFHTAEARYKPFAELLRRDGYRVDGLNRPFSANSLKDIDVLVIANALNERNIEEWSLPTPSAFMKDVTRRGEPEDRRHNAPWYLLTQPPHHNTDSSFRSRSSL